MLARGSASRLSTQAGVDGWPKLVPSRARVSPIGTAIRCDVRRSPLLRPVVVTSSTGSPASTSGALVRPRVSATTASSRWWSTWEKSHAPARVEANRWINAWKRLGVRIR